MANYKIGTMLRLSADVELKNFLGDKKILKKGTKIWIGADKLAHHHKLAHHQDGTIQPLPENTTVEGYDAKGITERIFAQLNTDLPLDEMCEEYEVDFAYIKNSIEYALEELGMC